jgi:hypothetical protein
MAHAGNLGYCPGAKCPQRRSGGVAGSDIIVRALVSVYSLTHRSRSLGEKLTGRLHVFSTGHDCNGERKQSPQGIVIDVSLTEAERPRVDKSGMA